MDNGAAAIDAIMQRRPQLLLTEIMLPMRSGYDVLDAVDGLGLGPDLLVLFVTAQSCEREMDRALIAGVSDYILKPFYPGELATRVKLALRRLACDQAQSAKPVRGSGLEVAA